MYANLLNSWGFLFFFTSYISLACTAPEEDCTGDGFLAGLGVDLTAERPSKAGGVVERLNTQA